MSRYIDADAFLANESEAYMNAQIKLAKENADKTIDPDRYINLLVHKKIQMLIADTPHIDIVRCKECKWAKANGTYQWCGRLDSTARITADDFCSYGERREP